MKSAKFILPLLIVAGIGVVWAQDARKEHSKLKTEHQQAHDEHDDWLKTISKWRVEHRKALASLREIESHILDHDAALEELAEHAREHEDHMRHHDMEIDEHDQTGDATDHTEFVKSHKEMLAEHAQVKKQLGMFHDDHEKLMESLSSLRESFSKKSK